MWGVGCGVWGGAYFFEGHAVDARAEVGDRLVDLLAVFQELFMVVVHVGRRHIFPASSDRCTLNTVAVLILMLSKQFKVVGWNTVSSINDVG